MSYHEAFKGYTPEEQKAWISGAAYMRDAILRLGLTPKQREDVMALRYIPAFERGSRITLEELRELHPRVLRLLKTANIEYFLVNYDGTTHLKESELRHEIKGFGEKCAEELRGNLAMMGAHLPK